ncbi:MAG: hypothetical protein IPP43_06695 [Chitinophagaceae bacterium]|nr:hypothetical protein [Chitinophagaceae bacterium]
MTKLESIKEALRNNTAYRDHFIETLVLFEKKGGHPGTHVRDTVSGPL